jgi:hypothetical protein
MRPILTPSPATQGGVVATISVGREWHEAQGCARVARHLLTSAKARSLRCPQTGMRALGPLAE